MELETINKLYLELSQITTATTAREILLQKQLAEAQRDAERLDWIIEHRAYVVSDPDCCDGYWLNYARPDGTMWTQATEHETPRAAIDAAKGERMLKHPAEFTVHTPTGPVHSCFKHARQIEGFMRMLGAHTHAVKAPDGVECANCINEAKAKGEPS